MNISPATRLLAVALPLLVWSHPYAATLDVCRSDGVAGPRDLAPVDIAAATIFADVGPSDPDLQTGKNFLPVRIVTDNPAVVHLLSSCVQVPAHVVYNPRHLPVGPAQRRMYRPVSGDAREKGLSALPLDRFS